MLISREFINQNIKNTWKFLEGSCIRICLMLFQAHQSKVSNAHTVNSFEISQFLSSPLQLEFHPSNIIIRISPWILRIYIYIYIFIYLHIVYTVCTFSYQIPYECIKVYSVVPTSHCIVRKSKTSVFLPKDKEIPWRTWPGQNPGKTNQPGETIRFITCKRFHHFAIRKIVQEISSRLIQVARATFTLK